MFDCLTGPALIACFALRASQAAPAVDMPPAGRTTPAQVHIHSAVRTRREQTFSCAIA